MIAGDRIGSYIKYVKHVARQQLLKRQSTIWKRRKNESDLLIFSFAFFFVSCSNLFSKHFYSTRKCSNIMIWELYQSWQIVIDLNHLILKPSWRIDFNYLHICRNRTNSDIFFVLWRFIAFSILTFHKNCTIWLAEKTNSYKQCVQLLFVICGVLANDIIAI